jgi:hypothetical protein
MTAFLAKSANNPNRIGMSVATLNLNPRRNGTRNWRASRRPTKNQKLVVNPGAETLNYTALQHGLLDITIDF